MSFQSHPKWSCRGAVCRICLTESMRRKISCGVDRFRLLANDRGAITAEYAIVIMAAVAFAGLLVAIMGSSEVRALLVGMVQKALGSAA